jgi:hypothetical protein
MKENQLGTQGAARPSAKEHGGDETVALGPFGVSEETDAGYGDRAEEKGCKATNMLGAAQVLTAKSTKSDHRGLTHGQR